LRVPTRCKHKIRTKVYFLTPKRVFWRRFCDLRSYPTEKLLVAGCWLLEMPLCLRRAKRVATVEEEGLPATNNQKPATLLLWTFGPKSSVYERLFYFGSHSDIGRGYSNIGGVFSNIGGGYSNKTSDFWTIFCAYAHVANTKFAPKCTFCPKIDLFSLFRLIP
jgi:hypothetical protein